jgi:hypothetical protein
VHPNYSEKHEVNHPRLQTGTSSMKSDSRHGHSSLSINSGDGSRILEGRSSDASHHHTA